MNSEFQQLANKVEQTVALIQVLREENADLRRQVATLNDTNVELTTRVQQAHDRVSILLTKLPSTLEELA